MQNHDPQYLRSKEKSKINKNLSDRLEDFAVEIIKLSQKLGKSYAGRHIGGQLIKCSTSAGANYEESCGAESRSDFIHKLHIVLKELRESLYWLRLSKKSELLLTDLVDPLLQEGKELSNIIGKSIVTARENK